jgi:dTDP-4-dehydrorhamnose 3,5-epimerase
MKIIDSKIADVKLIQPDVFGDERGFFMETWNQSSAQKMGLDLHFVQDNHSRSMGNVLRGMHYQLHEAQGKLVRVTAGAVFDVAVDIRKTSPTFGEWVGYELSAENKLMLWIPPGFAHGFMTLTDNTDFLYKCTNLYAPQHERTIAWNDPDIGIAWPLDGIAPILSNKDKAGLPLNSAELFA